MINNQCPVCQSSLTFYLRHLRGQRSNKWIKLSFCSNCYSLFNPSGYQEDEKRLIADREWHIKVFDKNIKSASNLLSKLKSIHPQSKTCLDIGAGIGAIVLQAKKLGLDAEGIEPNSFAVEYAKDKFLLELKHDYFRKDSFSQKFDIITCTEVLEHLENPQQLFEAAVNCLNPSGLLFVSVPFRPKNKRLIKYLLLPNLKGTPFFDNDVHIVHFSHKSFKLWAEKYGASSCQYMSSLDNDSYNSWKGYLFRFD